MGCKSSEPLVIPEITKDSHTGIMSNNSSNSNSEMDNSSNYFEPVEILNNPNYSNPTEKPNILHESDNFSNNPKTDIVSNIISLTNENNIKENTMNDKNKVVNDKEKTNEIKKILKVVVPMKHRNKIFCLRYSYKDNTIILFSTAIGTSWINNRS